MSLLLLLVNIVVVACVFFPWSLVAVGAGAFVWWRLRDRQPKPPTH